MRFEAAGTQLRQEPAAGRPRPRCDLTALKGRLERIALSQPTAVLGTLEFWLSRHRAECRVDLSA